MRLSINSSHFFMGRPGERARSVTDCLALVKEAGFRLVDMSLSQEEDPAALAAYLQELPEQGGGNLLGFRPRQAPL